MKGIVLAGGSGTRLYPITKGVSKQLLPVYDKPMIYYPVSVLMHAGIRDIMIISTPADLPSFRRLLGDGSDYGVRLEYAEQPSPDGIAQAFLIAERFIGGDSVCLILGDNIFQGAGFPAILKEAVETAECDDRATIFGYRVNDPERYGVAEFDSAGKCLSIEEKPSLRGEIEITSVNRSFLDEGRLDVKRLESGFAWLDTGTHDSLSEASIFIEVLEKRQGLKVACLEEIAFCKGWIDRERLLASARSMEQNQYGRYLLKLAESERY